MSKIITGVVWIAGFTGVGWCLMQTITPTEEQIREKLRRENNVSEWTRQNNKDLMAALKKTAGIEDDKNKKSS